MDRTTEDLGFIAEVSFRYASHILELMPISRKTAKKITSQPGYKSGEEMCIHRVSGGGYRLFVRVGEKWMDASLQDIK